MSKRGENIYKRKDGRWEGRYIKNRKDDGSIHYGYIYCNSYTETKEKLTNIKSLYYLQNYNSNNEYSGNLEQWSEQWLKSIKENVKLSTFVSYSRKLSLHVFPWIGKIQLKKLNYNDIKQWIINLEKLLAPSSIKVIFQVLNSCLKDAVKKKILYSNPCEQIATPKAKNSLVHSLSKNEENKLQVFARSHPKGLPILLSLQTGLRIGEICGLKWKDIDFSSNVLYVRRTIQRLPSLNEGGNKKTMIVESSPKSDYSIRSIPIPITVHRELLILKETSSSSYVFGQKNPAEPRLINYWFKKIINELDMPNYRFHCLRHTFATRCLEKGVNIATISALLGHHSIKMTLDTYISSFLSEKREAIKLITYT